MKIILSEYRGILLSTIVGLTSHFLSDYLPSAFNGVLVALILGMVLGNLVNIPDNFQAGIGFTSSKMLEFSILFLAFSINYTHIAKLGAMSFTIVAVMVLAMLLITFFLSRKMNCPGSTGWLVGFGTTICGSSAIAALSPGVTKNKDDVVISMAVVNLFGLSGMLVFPVILPYFNLNSSQIGLLIGGTLHSVGNVAGAGYSMGQDIGAASITIKLARVALLTPALIFFNYLVTRHEMKSIRQFMTLPWYLWGFIIITIFSSLVPVPDTWLDIFDVACKIILTIAMAAIGMKVRFRDIFVSGRSGLYFGAVVFAIQILIVGVLMLLV